MVYVAFGNQVVFFCPGLPTRGICLFLLTVGSEDRSVVLLLIPNQVLRDKLMRSLFHEALRCALGNHFMFRQRILAELAVYSLSALALL